MNVEELEKKVRTVAAEVAEKAVAASVEKVLTEQKARAIATEVAEKAIGDREAAQKEAAEKRSPVVAGAAEKSTCYEAIGFQLQAEFAQRMLARQKMSEDRAKQFFERAANARRGFLEKAALDLTTTTGLELNGPKTSPEIIQALSQKSFLLRLGCELWDGYDTVLNLGKWGGFTVIAVDPTESPSEDSAATANLQLLAYFGAAKRAVSNQLLANPRAGATLAEDLMTKLANFVDTKIIAGSGSGGEAVSLKSQASSSPDCTVACTANAVTVEEIVGDITAGLAVMDAAGHDTSQAFIVMKPALFWGLVSLRDVAGFGFPAMQGNDPRILGRRVVSHNAPGSDVMIGLPDQIMVGLPLPPNAGVGMEGTDLSGGTQTVFGRVGYDGKLKNSTGVYFITGAGTTDGWLDPA